MQFKIKSWKGVNRVMRSNRINIAETMLVLVTETFQIKPLQVGAKLFYSVKLWPCASQNMKRGAAQTLCNTTVEIHSHVRTQYFLFSLLLRQTVGFFFFKESVALLSVCHLPSPRFLSRARCRWRPGTPRPSGGRCIPSWSRPSPRTTDEPGCLKTLLDWNESQW